MASKKEWQSRAPDAERDAHQPLRAHRRNGQKTNDLVREAVGCMGVFGAPACHARVASRMR
jgi:hypothetical protein